jgi:autoinducer 2-degrading protein
MAKITFIARMTCKPDKEREFTALCRELADHVKKYETGVVIYEFYRLREANRYAVLESFADEAAEHAHMNSEMLAEFAPKISACLDGTWVREYFDELG